MNFKVGDKVNFICRGEICTGAILDFGKRAILVESTTSDREGWKGWAHESELALVKLPVVPRYVAEWIAESKEGGWTLIGAITIENNQMPRLVVRWLLDNADNQVLFARAWSGKYEVEDEPLYYVIFLDGGLGFLNVYFNGARLLSCHLGSEGYKTKFTESEIKNMDTRYWAFAVPVEEVEETR
ncbi:DUF1642 domain-containing protein [Listeria monocytogenes]|nr:DUF1642 domain-containing protein [Listeria monocytogenes]EAG8866812.1 DUF1642 domain-containing protein [Listeria monocytogenes]HAB0528603.1 DUF1642 domain-containing protein [Listeria monocytogenes]HAB0536607.1 DUF1642 domain-containing protein [Listeria monocytogenes]HAB0546409.1 DUF1642 domain-containing protein [Listeria monocytogenes]